MIVMRRLAPHAVKLGGLALGGIAFILSGALPAASPTQPGMAPADNPNKLVCEKQESTGSRLGGQRVCLTREAWAERRLQERQVVERAQAAPCMPTTTSSQGRTAC